MIQPQIIYITRFENYPHYLTPPQQIQMTPVKSPATSPPTYNEYERELRPHPISYEYHQQVQGHPVYATAPPPPESYPQPTYPKI